MSWKLEGKILSEAWNSSSILMIGQGWRELRDDGYMHVKVYML